MGSEQRRFVRFEYSTLMLNGELRDPIQGVLALDAIDGVLEDTQYPVHRVLLKNSGGTFLWVDDATGEMIINKLQAQEEDGATRLKLKCLDSIDRNLTTLVDYTKRIYMRDC